MAAQILDGKQIAKEIRCVIADKIKEAKDSGRQPPGLAVILVGNDPASQVYVTNKRKACAEVGIISHAYDLAVDTSEDKLVDLIKALNQDADIDGILVQLPLPPHINSKTIIDTISPEKDVDGFHPYNLGRLAQRDPLLRPCTPYGIIQLLGAYKIPLHGMHTVVVGASNIVGRPMALEFLLAGSTVTICHRFTKNLEQFIRMAEIVVVATGICDVVNTQWLNKSQIVIDVGMHRLADGHLRGDLDYEKASKQSAWITPVPGGVGPMTIATLLQNTWLAACNRRS